MALTIKCPDCGSGVIAPDIGFAFCDNCGWQSGEENRSRAIEYDELAKQNEMLIELLKPFAFMWQNKQTNEQNWKDCYRAQMLLIDIMSKEQYLKEAKDVS